MMNVYYFHHQADELLGTASEQFLGKSVKEIKQTILQTLEGHLRAILGKGQIAFTSQTSQTSSSVQSKISKLAKKRANTQCSFLLEIENAH